MKNLFDEDNQAISEYEMNQTQDLQDVRPTNQNYSRHEDIEEDDGSSQNVFYSSTSANTAPIAYELEEEEQDVVGEAMVRLEQARLYDMLIKHDLFDGVKANPIALKNVQKELKDYIVERLQILLGIKQQKTNQIASAPMRVELPFNMLEIQALKDLAYKLTKGATDGVSEKATAEAVFKEEPRSGIKPLSQANKPQTLRSLSPSSSPSTFRKQAQEPARTQNKPLRESNVTVNPTKKVKAPKLSPRDMMAPDGTLLTEEEILTAQRELEKDLNVGRSSKNPYEMSEEELIERSKKIKGQTKSTKVKGVPMPSPEQVHMMYQQKQMNKIQTDQNMTTILDRVLSQK